MPMIPVLHFVAVEEYGNDNGCNTRYADTDYDCNHNCGWDVSNFSWNKTQSIEEWIRME